MSSKDSFESVRSSGSLCSLHVLPVPERVLSRFSGFLPQSKDMQVGLIGDSKLVADVSVRMNGCLQLCVGPVIDKRSARIDPVN